MSDVLPVDIIHTILLNLPVKSLQRFKSVCKTWNTIISDRQFTKAHHRKSKNSKVPQNLFLCGRDYHQLYMFKFENGSLNFKALLSPQKPYGSILWIGDGLVLLRKHYHNTEEELFVLWNPSSREQTTFGCPYEFLQYWTNFGICYDPVNFDDYKVVMIYLTYYAVFSCKNKIWTEKQVFQPKGRLYPNAGLLVDGFSFWILQDDDDQNAKDIVYFDPREDKFKKLKKPTPLEGATTFFLTSLNGCLCSYDNTRNENNSTRLRVWIMTGHVDLCCWSELMNIQIVPRVNPLDIVRPMFFNEKNEIIINICKFGHNNIVRDHPLERAFETSHIISSQYRIDHDFPVVPYLDSLFFPIQDSIRPKRKRSSST